MNLDKVKSIVAEPLSEEDNISLNLYRGQPRLGRTQALWNFINAMFLAEIPSFTAANKLSKNSIDLRHLCGLHNQVYTNSLVAYCSRLWDNPQVVKQKQGLYEYLEWIFSTTRWGPYKLERLSRYSEWSTLSYRYKKGSRKRKKRSSSDTGIIVPTFYPFLTDVPIEEHELLMIVHDIVPKGLPEQVRQDVCQDIIVSILAGESDPENLRDNIKPFISEVFKQYSWKYGPLSLDAPPPWDDHGRPLKDTITKDMLRYG